jgi:hypothetical protein
MFGNRFLGRKIEYRIGRVNFRFESSDFKRGRGVNLKLETDNFGGEDGR